MNAESLATRESVLALEGLIADTRKTILAVQEACPHGEFELVGMLDTRFGRGTYRVCFRCRKNLSRVVI